MGRRFCVRCGAVEKDGYPIIDGLCPKCFVKERSILRLPSKIELMVCPSCFSLYVAGKWVKVSTSLEKIIEYYINKTLIKRENIYPGFTSVRVKVVNVGEGGRAYLSVEGKYRDAVLRQSFRVTVKINYRLCPRCLSIKTGSYDALIQIRYEGNIDKTLNRRIMDLITRYDRIADSITEIEDVKEGLNIKLMSQSVAKQLAVIIKKKFGARIQQSWTKTGYVSGRRHSKLTISVRLPALRKGDIVVVGRDGEVMLVNGSSGPYIFIKRLRDGKNLRLSFEELWSRGFRKLSSKEYSIVKGKILSYEGGYAVVQDVSTGNIFRVKAPELKDLGSDAELLIYKGETYLLR